MRFTATVVGTAIGLTAALAPARIPHPAAIVANTVAYPLGSLPPLAGGQPVPGICSPRLARPGTRPRSPCSSRRARPWSLR